MDFPRILAQSSQIVLAPLAGISDAPFRIISRKMGFSLAFLEMIHARSLVQASRKTAALTRTFSGDSPLGVQLLGNEEYYLEKALEKLQTLKHDILDFNAACPQRKVTGKGEGAALLKDPLKLQKLLRVLVKNASVPVTVKIRLGWDNANNVLDIARACADSGISALFVHGRTKTQGYSGEIDYPAIRAIKDSLQIPVIASGNIFEADTAAKMFKLTGCDGIIAARGALGNPWIFREINAWRQNCQIPPRPVLSEIAQVMREHFTYCVEYHGPLRAVKLFRRFYVWYSRGINNIKNLRMKVMRISSAEEMYALIEEFALTGKARNERGCFFGG